MTVLEIPMKAESGTAYCIDRSKKISSNGILLPAPDRPPMVERHVRRHIRNAPVASAGS